MQNRRDFLKTAAFAALGSGVVINDVFGGESAPKLFNINKSGVNARMKLRFFPYELKLRHVFTVATYSRTTTPDVQVEIEYDGVIGYGEASMPPYLQKELGTMESVLAFLKKVQDIIGQFPDPFQLEDILAYVDKLSPGDAAAKAAVDIALHDLVGKLLRAPWYKIWGLDKEKAPSTTFTIGIDTPDVVREKTKECAEQFNILKVKLGRENDKEMIETIRSVTDLPIAVDANQGWTDKHYAIDMIQWLKEKGIVMIEQPMPKTQLDDIDLKALEELTNSMQCLVVKVKCINNIDSLTMLANLRHLELRAENIKDIRPLRNLRRVRYLKVSKNFWTSLQVKRIAKELDLRVRKYSDYYILDLYGVIFTD